MKYKTVTKEYKQTPAYILSWYETNKFNKDIFTEYKKGDKKQKNDNHRI